MNIILTNLIKSTPDKEKRKEIINKFCIANVFNQTPNTFLAGDKPKSTDAEWLRNLIVETINKGVENIDHICSYLSSEMTPEQIYSVVKIIDLGVTNFKIPNTEVAEMLTIGFIDINTYARHVRGMQEGVDIFGCNTLQS